MENYKGKTPRIDGILAEDRPISRMGDSLSSELSRFCYPGVCRPSKDKDGGKECGPRSRPNREEGLEKPAWSMIKDRLVTLLSKTQL